MASGKDKNGVLLAVGDVVDCRGRIVEIDRLTGLVFVRVGATLLAIGTAPTDNVPDPSQVLTLNQMDVAKVP